MELEEFNYSQVKSKGQFFTKAVNVVNCWEEVIEINPVNLRARPDGRRFFLLRSQSKIEGRTY